MFKAFLQWISLLGYGRDSQLLFRGHPMGKHSLASISQHTPLCLGVLSPHSHAQWAVEPSREAGVVQGCGKSWETHLLPGWGNQLSFKWKSEELYSRIIYVCISKKKIKDHKETPAPEKASAETVWVGRGQLTNKCVFTDDLVWRHQSPPDATWNIVGPTRLGNSIQQAAAFSVGQSQGKDWGKLAKGQSKRSEMPFQNTPETTQETWGTWDRTGGVWEVKVTREKKFFSNFCWEQRDVRADPGVLKRKAASRLQAVSSHGLAGYPHSQPETFSAMDTRCACSSKDEKSLPVRTPVGKWGNKKEDVFIHWALSLCRPKCLYLQFEHTWRGHWAVTQSPGRQGRKQGPGLSELN